MIWIEHLPILKWQNLYPQAKDILTIDNQLMRWNILGNYNVEKTQLLFLLK